MSENKDTFLKRNELETNEETEQEVTKAQDVDQSQKNTQSQDQDLELHQDVDQEQTQNNSKKLNLLINSDSMLPDLTTGILKGVVRGDEDKLPLHNASVQIYFGMPGKEPLIQAETNSFGEFKVEDLPAGFYSIEVIKENYLPESIFNFRVRASQEVMSEINLKPVGDVTMMGIVQKNPHQKDTVEQNTQDVDQLQINEQNQNQVSTMTQDVKLKQKQIFNPTVNIAIIAGGSDLRDLTVGKITGAVLGSDSGLPLKNRAVEIFFGSDTQIPIDRKITNEQGQYVFDDLPSGFYTVKAVGLGRKYKEIFNIRVRPGKENKQDLTL